MIVYIFVAISHKLKKIFKKQNILKYSIRFVLILASIFFVFQIITSILLKSQFVNTVVSNPVDNAVKIQRKLTESDIHLQKTKYDVNEEMVVELGRYVPDKLFVYTKTKDKERKPLEYKLDANGKIMIDPPSEISLGMNTIEITDGVNVIYTQDFLWGVLAMNTDKDTYMLKESANIQMSVLDDKGEMVCKADVSLNIISPSSKSVTLSTKSGDIKVTDYCQKKEFTLIPDYEAKYLFEEVGEYTLKLTAVTVNGEKTIEEKIQVKEKLDFQITRETATRIYPVLTYPVTIKLKAYEDFSGIVEEFVPTNFNISEVENSQTEEKMDTVTVGNSLKISYKVSLKEGEEVELKYKYKAPNVSPEFYTIGKVNVVSDSKIIYEEQRAWQIASDAAGYEIATRLWTSGFELNSTTAGMEYTSNIGTTPTISTGTIRSGTYSLNTTLAGAGTSGIRYEFTAAADSASSIISRANINIATLPSTTIQIMCMRDNAGTYQLCIRMTATGILQLWNEEDNAQVGSNSSALSTNTWYRLEMLYDFGTAATADSDTIGYIDGAIFASSAVQNYANGNTFADFGILQSATGSIFWDDMAINDGGGSKFTPGEGKVVSLHPNGNGTNVAWTNDFNNVKEVTPDDAATVISCTANGQLEDYTYEDTSARSINANDTIKLVQGNVRIGGAASNLGNSYSLTILNAGAATDASATVALAVATTYYTNDDSFPQNPVITSYDNPGATNYDKLTPTIVDGITTRINAVDCSPVYSVSNIWLTVEYVPAEGGRIFSSGFELQSVTDGMEFDFNYGTPVISTATKRSGNAALQITSLVSATIKGSSYQFGSANANGPYYFRAYLYITTAPSAENRIITIVNATNAAIAYITLDNSRLLKLYDNTGVIGSASGALATTTWYRIEMKVDASGAGATDTVEAKLDNLVFATSSTRTLTTGVIRFIVGGNLNSEAQTTGNWFFDDLALNQNVGTTQNGYPGPGKIVHLLPNAAGDTTTWANTYTNLDETTPNDGTDYISTSTIGFTTEVNMQDSATYSIDSTYDIKLVSAGNRAALSAAATSAIVLRVKEGAVGPLIHTDNIMVTGTTYTTNKNTIPRNYGATLYTRPSQNTAWTTTALDGLQIGVRESVDSASDIRVTSLFALVEYTPTTINVSGICKIFNEITDCGDTGTIRVAVGATLQAQTQPTVAGTWTVAEIVKPAANSIITVYVEGAANADKANAVTKYDGTGDVTGVSLFKEHLSIGSNDNASLINTDIGTYDNSVSASADVFFDNSVTTLTVDNTGFSSQEKICVLASNTFTPGGTVNTVDLSIKGTLSAAANTLNVNGSWENLGLFTAGTSTVNMTSTATGRTLSGTMTTTSSFYNLTFNGVAGAWSFGANNATVAYDFTITAGTVTAPSTTLAIGNNYSNSGTFTHNSGTVLMNSADITTKTMSGTMTTTSSFYNLTFNGAGLYNFGANSATIVNDLTITSSTVNAPSTTLTITGNYSNSGTFTNNSGTVLMNATDAGNTLAGTLSGATGKFYNLTFNGSGGAWSFTSNPAVEVANNLTITLGTLTSTSNTLTITGNYSNSGTFTNNSGTVLMNATAIGKTLAGTLSGATGKFYNLTFNGSGGAWSFTSNPAVEVANNLTITLGTLTSTSNTLTVTGNYSNSGTYTHNSGTVLFNSTTTGKTLAGTLSGATGKFYNLTFNGSGGAWSFTSNPAVEVANDFTITAGTLTSTSNTLTITGNYSNSGTFTNNSGTVLFNSTTTGKTLAGTMNSASSFYNLTFNGVAGAWSFTSNPTVYVLNDFIITAGTVTSTSDSLNIWGSYSNSGIYTHNSGTIVMFSSVGGKTFSGTMTGTSSFYNLSFLSAGAWSFGANSATVANDLIIGSGTVTAPSTTLTITGNYSNAGTFTNNSGTVVMNSTAIGKTLAGTLSGATGKFYDLTFNGSGGAWSFTSNPAVEVANNLTITTGTVTTTSATLTVTGSYSNGGTFTNNSGTVLMNSTATGKTLAGTMTTTSSFYNLTFNGVAGAWSFGANSATVANDLIITNGTLTAPSTTLTITGNYSNAGTFTHNSGTVLMNATTTGKTLSGKMSMLPNPPSSFNNLTFNGVGGAWTFSNSAVILNNFTLTAGTVTAPAVLQIFGSYSNSGTFTHNSGTVSMMSQTSGKTLAGTMTGSSSFYDLTFDDSGSGGAWSFTSNPAVTVANNFTITAGIVTSTSTTLTITGSYSNGGTFTNNSGTVLFNSTSTGKTLAGTMTTTSSFYNLQFDGIGGAWSFGTNNGTVVNNLSIANGTLTAPSTTLLLSGNFTKTGGTFTHNSGTLTLDDYTKTSTLTYNSATTFYNFTSIVANKQIFFDNVDQTNITGTFTINGQACGSFIQLYSDSSGTQYELNATGTVSVTYAQIKDSNAIAALTATNSKPMTNNTNWTITGGACNTAPNVPTSLAQKFTSDVVINTGDWINQTSVKFTATISDTNNPDTIYLCLEILPIATTFTNYETGCGSSVAYSGSPVGTSVTLPGITDQTEYHWQVRTKDIFGEYSSWVSYGGNAESARDVGLDNTVPTGGIVYDGTSIGSDISYNSGSLSTLSANWSGFDSTISGLNHYDYSIGTTQGATDVITWTSNGTTTTVTVGSLTLNTSSMYFFNIRATDNATNIATVSSNGQVVAPSLSFSLDTSTVNFSNLNSVNSYENTKTNVLTTSTNAYNGYVIKAYATDVLRSVDNSTETIPNFSLGSYATPSGWTGSNYGFGYSSSDTSVQGSAKFPSSGSCLGTGTAPCYAPFASTGPGDIVADHTATVSGTSITNETFTITYKVKTQSTQTAGKYQTSIVYTVIPQY